MKKLFVIALAALMALTSGCAFVQSTLAETPTPTPTPTTFPFTVGILREDPSSYGYIIDGKGMTLYFNPNRDTVGKSNISGAELTMWPIFYSETIVVSPGLEANEFGTITRDDGAKQTTWQGGGGYPWNPIPPGYPLYYYAGDHVPGKKLDIPGDKLGTKVGGGWQVISFTFLGPPEPGIILLSPTGGSTTSLRPIFSWAPFPNATEYEFIIATNTTGFALTNTVVNVNLLETSYQLTFDLQPNTTYFWSVQTTAPTRSPTSFGSFTTMTPVATTPPVTPTETANVPPQPTATVTETAPSTNTSRTGSWLIWGSIGGVIIIVGLLVSVLVLRKRAKPPN